MALVLKGRQLFLTIGVLASLTWLASDQYNTLGKCAIPRSASRGLPAVGCGLALDSSDVPGVAASMGSPSLAVDGDVITHPGILARYLVPTSWCVL